MSKLQRDEMYKNVLLQRTEADIAELQACEAALRSFFSPRQMPEFLKATQLQSRFTPNVEITSGADDSPRIEAPVVSPSSPSPRLRQRALLSSKKIVAGHVATDEQIVPVHVGYKFVKACRKMSKLLNRANADYETLISYPEELQLVPSNKVKALKRHITIIEQIMAEKQQEVERLASSQSSKHRKGESMGEIQETPDRSRDPQQLSSRSDKLPQLPSKSRFESRFESRQSPEIAEHRKYHVNLQLLQRRDKMSAFEIMERRYDFMDCKDITTHIS